MKKDNYLFLSFPNEIRETSIKENVKAMKSWLKGTKMLAPFKKLLKTIPADTAKIYDGNNTHWFLITEKDGVEVIVVVGFIEAFCTRFFVMTRLKRKNFYKTNLKHKRGNRLIKMMGCGITYDTVSDWNSDKKAWETSLERDNLTPEQKVQLDNVLKLHGLGAILTPKIV